MGRAILMRAFCALAALSIPAFISPLLADDFAAPWWRLQDGTTTQEWEYRFTNANGQDYGPDGDTVQQRWQGTGDDDIPISSTRGTGWGRSAVGDGEIMPVNDGASIEYHIPNFVSHDPLKYIRVQITYRDTLNEGRKPAISRLDPGPPESRRFGDPQAPAAGHVYEDWLIAPCPSSENIFLDVPKLLAIDEVIIDTWCTAPEPDSLCILAIATLALIPRRVRAANSDRG